MMSSEIMAVINDFWSMMKQIDPCDQTFGNVSVLVVGDLYELPPVKGSATFE